MKFSLSTLRTDAPFTSPLDPSWVGFTAEETEIFKGTMCIVCFLLPVVAVFSPLCLSLKVPLKIGPLSCTKFESSESMDNMNLQSFSYI